MQFFICSTLYFLGFIVFGWYINLVEYIDIFSCILSRYTKPTQKTYDYIIVGAGSAGSTIANRLAQNTKDKILVLEAGPNGGVFFDIPAIAPMLQLSTVDWQYRTVPQKHACKAFKGNTSFWPMGRLIGGTSMFNNLIYTKATKDNFEEWFRDLRNFEYERDILPYVKKTTYNLPSQHHQFSSDLVETLTNSFQQMGYKMIGHNQDEEPIGFMPVQVNLKRGKRLAPGHILLKTSQTHYNLQIMTNAHVEKLLLKSNFEAQGVKFDYLGQKYVVKAEKALILSAGVIGTPKILMLSGIGPRKILDEVGITSKIQLPVGENLQDHVATGFDLIQLEKPINFNFIDMCSLFSIYKYFLKGQGPWTMTGAEFLGFLNATMKTPELEFMALPMGMCFEGGHHLLKSSNLKEDLFQKYFQNLFRKVSVTLLPVVLHPRSRGKVLLRDKNPYSSPIIDPNYLSAQYDVDILIEGIEFIKKILNTDAMRELGARLNNQTFPGCEHFDFDTKQYWECYVRHLTLSSFHPVGTCKMGPVGDSSSVVDYNFQVHSTNKLYIVDGSILPTLPSANPNAAIITLAEKLFDILRYHNFLRTGTCLKTELLITVNKCFI